MMAPSIYCSMQHSKMTTGRTETSTIPVIHTCIVEIYNEGWKCTGIVLLIILQWVTADNHNLKYGQLSADTLLSVSQLFIQRSRNLGNLCSICHFGWPQYAQLTARTAYLCLRLVSSRAICGMTSKNINTVLLSKFSK